MSETLTLPVLPIDDDVVLPHMVVPLDLSESEVRAAIDAARAAAGGSDAAPGIRSRPSARVLLVPRMDGKYGPVGTVADE